jgi:hypothetical protein
MLVDGYVRVSRVAGRRGERFMSPKLQREQIAVWSRVHRASIERSGGMAHWAAEYGFDYPPPRRRPSNAKAVSQS